MYLHQDCSSIGTRDEREKIPFWSIVAIPLRLVLVGLGFCRVTSANRCRYDENRHKDHSCSYNQNKAYVVFSAMGSFFVPLVVVVYVYFKISCVIAERHNKLEALNGPKLKVNDSAGRTAVVPQCLGFECSGNCETKTLWKNNRTRLSTKNYPPPLTLNPVQKNRLLLIYYGKFVFKRTTIADGRPGCREQTYSA